MGAIGIAITLMAWTGVQRSAETRLQARFEEMAAIRAERLGYELERYRDDLRHIASHISGSADLDAASFRRLAAARSESLNALHAIAWVVPVSASHRGIPHFTVNLPKDRPAVATEDPAVDGDPGRHFTVRYIAHFAADGAGVDPVAWADASSVTEALERAARTRRMAVSAPVVSSTHDAPEAMYAVAVPVYRSHEAGKGSHGPLRGYVIGMYRGQAVVDATLRNMQPPLALRIRDRGAARGADTVGSYEPSSGDSEVSMRASHPIALAIDGRTWEIEFAPTDAFVASHSTDEALLTLLLGLALTGAAALVAIGSARWRSGVLELVASRTAELAAAEARQRAVVANMADALVVTDSDGNIESVNAAAQRLFGWDARDLIGRRLSMLVAGAGMDQDGEAGGGDFSATGEEQPEGVRRDGSRFPIAISLSEVHEQHGMRRVALMRNVSRERRAERAMSTFIASTSNTTGRAFLDAATRALAQALGVRYAFIAEPSEARAELRIVSFWSGQAHEPEQSYPIAGEPCEAVFGEQLPFHAQRVRELFPNSRLMAQLEAQCYLGHPLRASGGRPLGIVAIADVNPLAETALATSLISITAARVAAEMERLAADEALLRSRERLELAVEGSQLALWDLNVATGEVFLSERWSTMLGEKPGPLIMGLKDLFESVHPEDRATVDQVYRGAITGALPFYEATHRVTRSDGAVLWVRSHGKVSQRDEAGRALRLVGTNADVTWEKTTVEEVARRERELSMISDNVPATIVRLDRELRFLYVNQRYARLVGRAAGMLRDRRLADVIGEEAYQGLEAHFQRALAGDMVTFDHECTVSGERRWLEVTVIPERDASSAVQGCLAIGIDITERKEIERRSLDARRNAEEAARTKSEFLATMSHEIRTPMNGVIGLAGLLRDTDLNTEQREYVDTLHRSATALLDILNDILDMSKIEAGKLALEPIEFDLATTVEDVAALWEPKAAAKGLELIVEIDASCPRRVLGDAGRLGQVLGNLVGNAIKYTEAGHVYIRARRDASAGNTAHVLFEVEDTGVGIVDELHERLFRPFSQADGSTTRRFGGTGLGLAICRRLVDLMGGEIDVTSEPGQGSRFWFRASLPSQDAQPADEITALHGLRILLVEHYPLARESLARQLGAHSALVMPASDAAEALRLFEQHAPFDLALIDQNLPDLGGLALGSRLSRGSAQAMTKVLLTRGKHRIASSGVERYGFIGTLRKPLRLSALQALLVTPQRVQPAARDVSEAAPAPRLDQFGGRVLLVEDNEVNRRVAVTLLRKFGLEVESATNGREALDCIERATHQLVLMDMHMPEMDGLEATRAIRQREQESGRRRLPIVAMTANVMPEAREVCYAAGMDGFLAKPFVREQLIEELKRWLPVKSPALAEVVPLHPREAPTKRLDAARLDDLRAAMGADFSELVTVFLQSADELMTGMTAALEANDASALYRQAHTLKSSAANLGASELSRLAKSLEGHARAGHAAEFPRHVADLREELDRVQPLLQQAGAPAPEEARNAVS